MSYAMIWDYETDPPSRVIAKVRSRPDESLERFETVDELVRYYSAEYRKEANSNLERIQIALNAIKDLELLATKPIKAN